MKITIKTYEAGKEIGNLEAAVGPNMGDYNRPMKKAAIELMKNTNTNTAEVFCLCPRCNKVQPILSVGKNIGGNGHYDWFVQHTCV